MERLSVTPNIEKVINRNPDTIIVLGSGLHISKVNPDGKLSSDERMRIYAGLELCKRLVKNGQNSTSFIFCGDNIYKDFPSLSSVAKNLVSGIGLSPSINLYTVGGTNTLSDIDLAAICMKSNGLSRGVVISNEYHHVPKFYSSRRGLMYLTAEELLQTRDHRYEQIVDDLRKTKYYRDSNVIQIALSLILSLPFDFGKNMYLKKSNKNDLIAEQNDPYKLRKMTGKIK